MSILVSRSGDETAAFTASRALLSPVPYPIPICASPLPVITVCTSAKSRLIIAVSLIRSVIP